MDGYPFAGTYPLLIAKRWQYNRASGDYGRKRIGRTAIVGGPRRGNRLQDGCSPTRANALQTCRHVKHSVGRILEEAEANLSQHGQAKLAQSQSAQTLLSFARVTP
jgi:hypothetical protein